MKKSFLILPIISFLVQPAWAGRVSDVFNNYVAGTTLVGFDSISKSDCTLEFKDYRDGRTMSYRYMSREKRQMVDALTDTYQANYEEPWFKNYISTEKEQNVRLVDVFGPGGQSSYKHTLKVYVDDAHRITGALYTDDLNNTKLSSCRF